MHLVDTKFCVLIVQDGGEEPDGVDGEGGDGQENGHYSDTTASANGSDDDDGDGSTAATDGSNLRASPAEHVSIYIWLCLLGNKLLLNIN